MREYINSNITNYIPKYPFFKEDIEYINNYFDSVTEEYADNYSIFKDKNHYEYCVDNDIAYFCCGISIEQCVIKTYDNNEHTYLLVYDYGH